MITDDKDSPDGISHGKTLERRAASMTRLLPLLVLLLILGCSLFVWHSLNSGYHTRAKVLYHDKVAAITGRIVGRLHDQEQVLLGGVGLFNAKGEVNRLEWKRYVDAQRLETNLPGILGMGYTIWLTPSQKKAFVAAIRSEGFPDFFLRPEGERPFYTSIIYLEPFNWRNQRAFGYDMYSEPVRRAAMDKAVREGMTTISGKVILVQETEKEQQKGILMYLPVYRKGMPTVTSNERRAALRGYVYSPIRMNDFVHGTLQEFPDDVAFEIYDGAVCTPEHRLFSSIESRNIKLPADYDPDLASTTKVEVYGRTWTISFRSLAPLTGEPGHVASAAFLVGGILLSIVAAFATSALLATRERALKMAGKMVRELAESREKETLILNSTAEAIYGIDTEGRCTFCNAASLRLLGYDSAEELLGKNMHDQIHYCREDGSHFPVHECRIFSAFQSDSESHADDEVLWRKDGTCFHAEYWSYPQRKEGKVVGAVVTFVDITERKELEEELQLQAAQLEAEVAQRQQAQESLAEHALRLEQWNETLGKMVESEVSKNREKDKKLIQQDKLASIGQLAAGVAHEINNPIGFISSNLRTLKEYCLNLRRHYVLRQELIARHLPPDIQEQCAEAAGELGIAEILDDVPDLIAETLEGASRVAKIVNDLKVFSRVDSAEFELVEVSSCLESALNIAFSHLKYKAVIEKEYSPVPMISCHRGRLNQVFINLLVNAGQAITSRGEIRLRTWCDDHFVYASVSDSGHGIAPDTMQHIFDPFFTTKEVGSGTGLGLSISYDIIKQHGGELWAESVEGSGATFIVKLPRSSGAAHAETAGAPDEEKI